MKISTEMVTRATPWAIPLLTIGIFLLDLKTPIGVAISVLYVLPLLLTFFSGRRGDSLVYCIAATILLWSELWLKPGDQLLEYAAVNRALGTCVLWIVGFGMFQLKRMQWELLNAETLRTKTLQDLTAERIERSHAEGLMEAAQQARAQAESAVMGAVAGRQRAEEQYLVSKLRLEGIIESAMDAIITIDDEQKVVVFNDAAERMFQCSAQEAIGRPLDKFIPARFREAHRHHVKGFGQSGVTTRKMGQLGTVTGLRGDGEEFPLEAAISQVTVQGHRFYTAILRDVSERRRLEE
ncbi:MAG TPA: PAS domain S-box protein, partial [Nitrospira sp.]|nr:PAS domain S-box protein [Nitrospira sp.]